MLKGKSVSTGIGFGTILILKDKEKKVEKKIVEDNLPFPG